MEAPRNRRFCFDLYSSSPWAHHIGERKTTFAKTYGLEARCLYEEHIREHIVNLGNILRTH
jgi:hypothetical protein